MVLHLPEERDDPAHLARLGAGSKGTVYAEVQVGAGEDMLAIPKASVRCMLFCLSEAHDAFPTVHL